MSTITSIHEHAVEVDTRLAETHKHLSDINYKIQREESSIRRIVGQIWDWSNQVWNGTFAEAVAVTEFTSEWKAKGHAESIVNHDALIVVRDSLHIIIDECDADWRANGRWSRFYLVTNSNGSG